MKSKPHSTIVNRPSAFAAFGTALLAAIALFTTAAGVVAQNVTISAGDFQRMVYSAELHTQLALKPELGASLQVLLEMQRRNPNADPAALAGLSSQALQLYRANAPYYIRTNGYPDEILAAYLDGLRQVPAHTNFFTADLTLLNCFMLSQADYNYFTNDTVLDLINSADQRLSSSEGQAIKRQALVDNCVARAQGNAAFANAMEDLLWPETQVSLADTAAEIIGNTNSPLHGDLTMQTLLALSAGSSDGSVTVSTNQLMNLFTNEMQTIRNTINTNLAVLAEINQNQPDYLAYLTNQAAIDANVTLQATVQQGQPAQIACATAAVLVQSKLLPVNTDSAEAEKAVSGLGEIAIGIGSLFAGDPCGCEGVLSGGLDIFNMLTGEQSPQDAMANQISNIQTMVGDLSTNMNYRFDRVDQSLTTIYNTLNSSFSQITNTLNAQGHQIALLLGNVDDIRSSLVNVQAGLDRIESENFADFSDLLHQDMVTAIDGDLLYEVQFPGRPPMSATAYDGVENTFYTYATEFAAYNTVSPTNFSVSAGDFTGFALQTRLATYPLDANLNYIQQFLSTLGQSTGGTEPLANPQEWFIAADAYLQLAAENPMWFRKEASQRRVSDIISRGQYLTNFFGSLTFSGPNINWPLYNALEGYYVTNLVSFDDQVANTEYQYAFDNNFALGTWRQWDLAAPRVTATATAVQITPAIPSIPFSREPATNIAAGAYYSLALKADGTVVGWGDNSHGQTAIPVGLSNVVAMAAGADYGLALKADGAVVGWGDNSYGQTAFPMGLSNVVAMAAGADYGLALLTDGAVVGWGDDSFGQTNIPSGLSNVVAMAAGAGHSLALRADGTVVGWGDDYYGQATDVPMAVPPFTSAGVVVVEGQALSNVMAIAAGESFSLALLRDGTVFGWGENSYGEATGVASHQIPPIGSGVASVAGGTLSNVVAIAAGAYHSLALKADGTVVGWGANDDGQISIPFALSNVVAIAAGADHSLALEADGTVVAWGRINESQCLAPPALTWRGAIAAGYQHSLALKSDGTIVGWGDNSYGQINIPAGLSDVVAIAAGEYHSLALKADGMVVGWGDNDHGQTNSPTGLSNVVAIAAGYLHNLALKSGGTVVGWGANNYGQTNIPAGLTNVVAIAAGADYSLALKAGGTVVAWGDNDMGQTNVPTGLTNVVALGAGVDYSVALKADGTVVAWGDNTYGETTIPTGLSNVVAIAAGDLHILALKADGTVVAWGNNSYSQTAIPAGLSNVVAIAAGDLHSLALKADGTLVGWGSTAYGQVSNPAGLSNVVAIAAGYYHSVALKADGTVAAWGANGYGQTNSPTGLSNVVAIAAGGWYGLALEAGGTVVGWGDNNVGQISVPTGLSNVVAIAAGDIHSLALKADGTVVGWGYDDVGQTDVPTGLNNVVAIAAGGDYSVALQADGTVAAWGENFFGETDVPAGLNNVVAIAAGNNYGLALKADGTVVGWGYNNDGEATGVPSGAPGAVIIAGQPLTNVVAIAAGIEHSLALEADGTVVGWGDNDYGETGILAGLTNVAAISSGWCYNLFLTAIVPSGSAGRGGLSFIRAEIPHRVGTLITNCNTNTIYQMSVAGSLNSHALAVSGAKALLAAVLQLGMPYTLERDGVLHGFFYGNQSLMDSSAATYFLQTQNAQLQATPNAPPRPLTEAATLGYQGFVKRLNQCLTNLQATGQPENPRLVGHTLRLLDLLYDAWAPTANSPPPALEMSSQSNAPSLLLYGEPYVNYTLQYRDALSVPGWITTAITNLQDGQTITPPFSGGPHRFYRTVLPVP